MRSLRYMIVSAAMLCLIMIGCAGQSDQHEILGGKLSQSLVPPKQCFKQLELPTKATIEYIHSYGTVFGVGSYFDAQLTGVASGFDISNQMYDAFCVDSSEPTGMGPYEASVFSSIDPDLATKCPTCADDEQWDKINYILNQDYSSIGATWKDIQQAIWFFADANPQYEFPVTAAMQSIVKDAQANGAGFLPQPGQKLAVIMLIPWNQTTIIVVDMPPKVCAECKGGINKLTLRNNGPSARIRVFHGKEAPKKEQDLLFEGVVNAGATFTFTGKDKDGKMPSEISIEVDGTVQVSIHTSCSQPIYAGLKKGNFEIVSGTSVKGGELCPNNVTCNQCEACKGGLNELTLRNNGPKARIRVLDKKGNEVLFDDTVAEGQRFRFTGTDKDGKLPKDIKFEIDGVIATQLHTSCSKPVYIGLKLGVLEVTAGNSVKGGPLCAQEPPTEPPSDTCKECDGGMKKLTLRNNGASAQVTVISKKGDETLFNGYVKSGENFSINGTGKDGRMPNEIVISVNGTENARIHTSCSQPIYVGLKAGSFEITAGISVKGGPLCEQTPPSDGTNATACEKGKKIASLTMTYTGDSCSATSTTQDPSKLTCSGDPNNSASVYVVGSDSQSGGVQWFAGTVALNGSLTLSASNAGKDELKADTFILVYDKQGGTLLHLVRFHTSCSQPLKVNDQYGAFKVTGLQLR